MKTFEQIREGVTSEGKEEDFKPHMMYDPKTGKGYMAKKYEDHVRMDKMGYTHDKPDVKEVKSADKKPEKYTDANGKEKGNGHHCHKNRKSESRVFINENT